MVLQTSIFGLSDFSFKKIRGDRPPVEDDFLGTEGLGVIYAGKVGDYQEDGVGGILMDADVAAEARFSSLFSCRKGRPWIW